MVGSSAADDGNDQIMGEVLTSVSIIISALVIIALSIVIYVRKIYRNYSSMLMLVVIGLMAVDVIIFASLRLAHALMTREELQKATFINDAVVLFIFSSVS